MGRLEGQLLKSVALRPFSWLRFIDDIDMKWSHGREALTAFLDEANNFHPSIKFTAEISTEQHVFLDTATRNTAAKIFLTALHFASDVSALIRTPLNQEQEN